MSNFTRPTIPNPFPYASPANYLNDIPFVPYEAVSNSNEVKFRKAEAETQVISIQKNPPYTPTPDIDLSKPYGSQDLSLRTSSLGLPVISYVEFTDYILKNREPLCITNCLITVEQSPRVIKTYVIGKDKSIKTYIGQEDYTISISARIENTFYNGQKYTQTEGIYPREQVDMLVKIVKEQGSELGISIKSPHLEIYGINRIVVTNINLEEEEGRYGSQKVTITAIDDSYYEDSIYSPYYL